MGLQRTFLLSLYLTLALACAAMSYAVQPYLPELAYLTWGVIALLALAFVLEGRWTLSNLGANLVAIVIAAAAGLWVAYQLGEPPSTRQDIAISSAPLLPHLGALLMVLMVVKLFRPKRTGEYWWLYGIAFISVALACVLDTEAFFGMLLCAYAACSIWSLSLFYLVRGLAREAAPANLAVPWRGLGLPLAAGRALLVIGGGVLLFLFTPRLSGTAWPGTTTRPRTGMIETDIDLFRTGTIELNTEVAFVVEARERDGSPKLDLDLATRFRGLSLNLYSRGTWSYRPTTPLNSRWQGPIRTTGVVEMGPDHYTLSYTYTYRPRHRLVLAEPVIVPDDPELAPVVNLDTNNQPVYWLRLPNGTLMPPSLPPGLCRYVQVCKPMGRDSTPVHLTNEQLEVLTRTVRLPGLRAWTANILLERLRRDELSAVDLKRLPDGNFSIASYERLARVLEAHLARSGEYTYSLEQPRQDTEIDPVLDFLWNVKQGHCQRFASGLAVMLRSQGIPARVVVGFRGVEPQGNGIYFVRHSQAHAWVEALVARRDANGKWANYWLTLDPTPPGQMPAHIGPAAVYRQLLYQAESLWRNFVLEYHADKQAEALETWEARKLGPLAVWVLLLVAMAGVVVLLPRLRRRRPRTAPLPTSSDPLYAQLLRVLAQRCGLRPDLQQTPLEFADQASRRLQEAGLAAALPGEIVRLHYRSRYGGEAIPEPERSAARNRLDELERDLDRAAAAKPADRPAGSDRFPP